MRNFITSILSLVKEALNESAFFCCCSQVSAVRLRLGGRRRTGSPRGNCSALRWAQSWELRGRAERAMRAGATLILLLISMSRVKGQSPARSIHAEKKNGSLRCPISLLIAVSIRGSGLYVYRAAGAVLQFVLIGRAVIVPAELRLRMAWLVRLLLKQYS
jgi:hypothetical protein